MKVFLSKLAQNGHAEDACMDDSCICLAARLCAFALPVNSRKTVTPRPY
jgi:hypothetical protein